LIHREFQFSGKFLAHFNHCLTPRAVLRLMAAVLLVLITGGCSSDQKQTYPAKGKLVWDDGSSAQQLSGGMVIFQSDAEQISAKAAIDQQGSFVLGTYELDDGAVAGKHKVAIIQPASESGDYNPREIVDRRYESIETTDLEVTIEPAPNEIVLKLKPGAWVKKQK